MEFTNELEINKNNSIGQEHNGYILEELKDCYV